MPLISVIIPTYKRPGLLRRAIESVRAQTFSDWNAYISDDEEDSSAPTWQYLLQLARDDPRFHPLHNPPPHGQSPNTNNLLRAADGEWIKPLHDDDLLRPNCLEVFAAAVRGQSSVAMASCAIAEYVDGKMNSDGLSRGAPLLVRIPQRFVHLGMYLQDNIGCGVPSQVLVRRSAVLKGAFFEKPPGILSCVDSLWSMRVLQHGDSLAINAILAEHHQGSHESITGEISEESLDREFNMLREWQLPLIDPALKPPPLSTIVQMLRLIRAANRLRKRKFASSILLAARAPDPRAWKLFFEWYRRRSNHPNASRITKVIEDETAVRAALDGVRS